ncbi:hypothetical protein [Dactylosporangium sp. CA-233914]|uniref:hypothetical protein n=1 Tax=Dactylosporangium sp. CA-233914 TaxID=3239934 RepID=UPI003D915F68
MRRRWYEPDPIGDDLLCATAVFEAAARRREHEPDPRTTEALIARAAGIGAPVVAVEALWDGDTQGWVVRLVAIVRRPGRRHDRFDDITLMILRHGGDIRLFTGQVPPWPEAHQATEQGQAVARHFGVPFHFTSPQTPDINLPRWWDTP